MSLEIDYNKQMLEYYPEIIKAIREFRELIATQSVPITDIHNQLTKILINAYISTSDINQVSKWEEFLGIVPLPQGDDSEERWLSDRRETIIARLYTPQKLNHRTINDIVKIFTGGTADTYFKDGTIHVIITPPRDNKQYKFENVEQELRNKIPAHLMFHIERNYNVWSEIKNGNTWADVNSKFVDWGEVMFWTKGATVNR